MDIFIRGNGARVWEVDPQEAADAISKQVAVYARYCRSRRRIFSESDRLGVSPEVPLLRNSRPNDRINFVLDQQLNVEAKTSTAETATIERYVEINKYGRSKQWHFGLLLVP